MSGRDELRKLPQVDAVVEAMISQAPRSVIVEAARTAIEEARSRVLEGDPAPDADAVVARARALAAQHDRSRLRRVINATGVIIHTNLGRAPLGDEQIAAVSRVSSGYSNLEYDLETGSRGSRYTHARSLLYALTGAESTLVVNNNAAAVLLLLAAVAEGQEVIISRGELIEIGGEFRIPDVMAASRARLVEVGTTNRTNLADYERAIGPDTGAILKVHPSNYRVVGFTSTVTARVLARLARGRGVPLLHDLGSGLVAAGEVAWARSEPSVKEALEDGADAVTFSGDKLLGGPQAGVIAGRAEIIEKLARHPLLRALRPDKMTLAALEATLQLYLAGRNESLPVWRMALTPVAEIERRVRAVVSELNSRVAERGLKAEPVSTGAVTGGGSLPGAELSSWGVAITHPEKSADALSEALRRGDPPMVGRILGDRLVLDLRTVAPADDGTVAARVAATCAPQEDPRRPN